MIDLYKQHQNKYYSWNIYMVKGQFYKKLFLVLILVLVSLYFILFYFSFFLPIVLILESTVLFAYT
jgi:uncharacterized membrane protein